MAKERKTIPQEFLIRRDSLPHWQFGGSTYFITFRSKRGTLPDSARTQIAQNIWYEHGKRVTLHFGVIMPDHVHMIIQPSEVRREIWHDLGSIMKSIKGISSTHQSEFWNVRACLGR